ncbi:MAG: hypothetical protein AAFV95_10825 [Bacteroidota bacterium]
MRLIDADSGMKLEGAIEKVTTMELIGLTNDSNFVFDWSLEINNEVYKIVLLPSGKLLGLISLIDYPRELRIHINLIESSREFRGKDKSILNIPGCLIGFACKHAFKSGYEGFVSLIPKTQLIEYYRKNYGFISYGKQMAVFEEIAESLILKYFDDEV